MRMPKLPAAWLCVTLLLAGCSPPQLIGDPQAPYPPPRPVQVGDVLHLPTGTLLTQEQMLAAASDARIVYVGETHDNPASHRLELAVLQAMTQRYPGQVALGMEMFTPAQQDALDAWVAGGLSEKDFLKLSNWYGTWRMDFAYYRPLLQYARAQGIPVIGLNAEKPLVRQVGRQDFAELPAEQRSQLPELDLDDPYQQALTRAIFGGHKQGNSRIDGFLRVQTLWDETMAENVVRYLAASAERRRMVVVAGGNHVRFGFGIPRRVFRRLPLSYQIVGSKELVIPEDKQDRLMDVSLPRFPMPPYDFVLFTEYEDLGYQPVKLGVLLQDQDGQVRIERVIDGSAAQAAGLQAGDVITAADGAAVRENFDLVYVIQQKRSGDSIQLELLRDGQPLSRQAQFEPAASQQ